MIFVSGVHGVGKSYFADKVKQKNGIESLTASKLITDFSEQKLRVDKNVENIANNQEILLEALKDRKKQIVEFLLDGHFCLLNREGKIERVSLDIFEQLCPKAIVLLTEKAEVIAKRRFERDHIIVKSENIERFQYEEKRYALEVSRHLSIPIFVSNGSCDLEKAVEFVCKI